jgi:hypothetical protein
MLRHRSFWLAFVVLLFGAGSSRGFDDKAQTPVEVHEWSVWVANPAQTTWNSPRVYRNAMPTSVGTSRPKFEGKELDAKFPVASLSLAQFFGDPAKDVDVEVKIKQGALLAHWPPSNERGGRLQWFKSDLITTAPADIPPPYLPESHWFTKLRDEKTALYLKHDSVYERFIAYDTELTIPVPLKLRGGPDEYTLQNLTGRRLLDRPTAVFGSAGSTNYQPPLRSRRRKSPRKPRPRPRKRPRPCSRSPSRRRTTSPPPCPPRGTPTSRPRSTSSSTGPSPSMSTRRLAKRCSASSPGRSASATRSTRRRWPRPR